MILTGTRLSDTPIMGLQTGAELARTVKPLIKPDDLGIVAYLVDGPRIDIQPSILRVADIREFSEIGFIVDSSDEFITRGDVIKIDELLDLNFNLIGMAVLDENNQKLGKVYDYTIETEGFVVWQITVKRPLLKRINDTEFLIHRSQIIEINSDAIIVHSKIKITSDSKSSHGAYINPFRKHQNSSPAPHNIDRA